MLLPPRYMRGAQGRRNRHPAVPQIQGANLMTKLTDTQAVILSAASQRTDRFALPLPPSSASSRRCWSGLFPTRRWP